MVARTGKVYLVGVGPGAAGLMTIRARRVLEAAEVVVYDRLVQPRILNFAPANAKFVYVGKQSGKHTVQQKQIEQFLVRFAQQGKRVVRLKGGDPFVFGRGGEEADALVKNNIPWEIVPGVTSVVGVPAYAGIPLTHRDYSSMFTVISGHRASEEIPAAVRQLAAHQGTIVILMGVGELPSIIHDLRVAGMCETMPVAMIQWGTWGNHKVLTATLSTIVDVAKTENFTAPALIVIGRTVELRDTLTWFECLPFFGKNMIVVADTVNEALETADELESLGAQVFDFALERHVVETPEAFSGLLPAVLENIPVCIFLNSALGVHSVFQIFQQNDIDFRQLTNVRFAVSSDSAANAIRSAGCKPDFVGEFIQCYPSANPVLSTNVITWLHDFEAMTVSIPSVVVYELPPIENHSDGMWPDGMWIERMIRHLLPQSSVQATSFYKMREESESITAFVRALLPSYSVETRVLSETAWQFFHEIASRQGFDLSKNRTYFSDARAVL